MNGANIRIAGANDFVFDYQFLLTSAFHVEEVVQPDTGCKNTIHR